MTDLRAFNLLRQARDPRADQSREAIFSYEIKGIVDELLKADPATGKPAGKFSQEAIDLLNGKDVGDLRGIKPAEMSAQGKSILSQALRQAQGNIWVPGGNAGGQIVAVPPKHGHSVFLTAAGFAADAAGTRPANNEALGKALFHAGEWIQASFGTRDNLFAVARLDIPSKNAVLDQFQATLQSDMRDLGDHQKQQLIGNIAGLAVELIKSVEINLAAPVVSRDQRALITRAFDTLKSTLDDSRLGLNVKQMLAGYLQQSDSFLSKLEGAQKKDITARYEAYNPKFPFDYEAWDRSGKSLIRVDNIEGEGEGFVYGVTEWLKDRGLGDANWRNGKNTFELVRGDTERGPCLMRVTVAANDPINKWGRPMTVEIEISEFRNNMFKGLGREDVDITGYNGHSGFGRNTLKSFDSMPPQKGDKMFYRFVCAGVDVENDIALKAPRAFASSYTTQDSGYFRKKEGPHGEYAYEAEGWEAIRAMIRGVLGKKDHAGIQTDLKAHANWYGHTPGNDNNFVGPGDKRRGGSGDLDQDGIPNMFDVMPTINTFDVAADVAREFELKVPNVAVDQIKGDRAFNAIQFVNTSTNYTAILTKYNENRKIHAHPEGVWFEDRNNPPSYVRFKEEGGNIYVQLNSALADMTIETLRTVLFYETSKFLLDKHNPRGIQTQAEKTAANLLFAASALEYDMSWRDDAVFSGLKKMYGIPDAIPYSTFKNEMYALAERHNYGGDTQALTKVLATARQALSQPGVGEPSIQVG
jgi:hypothetical protein